MIQEGLKLTLLGMGVVYAFLGLLVMVMKLSARVMRPLTEKEAAKQHSMPRKHRRPRQQQETADKQRIMAVISAAIAAHRSREASLSAAIANPSAALTPADGRPRVARPQPTAGAVSRRQPGPARMLFRERMAFQVFLRK